MPYKNYQDRLAASARYYAQHAWSICAASQARRRATRPARDAQRRATLLVLEAEGRAALVCLRQRCRAALLARGAERREARLRAYQRQYYLRNKERCHANNRTAYAVRARRKHR